MVKKTKKPVSIKKNWLFCIDAKKINTVHKKKSKLQLENSDNPRYNNINYTNYLIGQTPPSQVSKSFVKVLKLIFFFIGFIFFIIDSYCSLVISS